MAYNPINLGPKTMAESQAVSLPTDQVAIPVKIDQTTPGTTNKVNIGTDGTVSLATAQTLATVTNLVQMNSQAISMGTGTRDAGTQRVTIATNDLVPVSSSASISGGVSSKPGSSPGGNFSLPIKTGPGQVYGWYFYNPNTAVAYVKIYNLLSGNPSSADPVCVLPIPPVSGANVFGIGISFDSNICITIATTRNGAGFLALDVDYNIFYK